MIDARETIEIQNFTSPGRVVRVNRSKYEAMKDVVLKVLPANPPGLTVAEAKEKLLPLLSQSLFPGGETAGWWFKAVQLDLEAKDMLRRDAPMMAARAAAAARDP